MRAGDADGGGGDLSWTRRGGQSLLTLPRVRRVFCGPGLGLLGSEGGLNEGQVRKRWVTELPRLQGPDQGGEQGRVERAVSRLGVGVQWRGQERHLEASSCSSRGQALAGSKAVP